VEEADPVTAQPGALDAAAVRRVWDEVLTIVRRRSQKAWALVRDAMVRDAHGDEIVLVFQHAAHANMFNAQADLLAEAVREVLGGTWRIRVELGGDARAGSGGDARSAGPTRPATPAAPDRAGSKPTKAGAQAKAAPARTAARPAAAAAAPSSAAPPYAAPSTAGSSGATDDRGWPETARPGGAEAASGKVDATPPPPPAPARGPAPRKTAPPKGRAGGRVDSAPPPDEPPFDPDYDQAPVDRAGLDRAYEGFDPGDEPLDDATTVRESSEEQAIRAVGAHFAVERIGETNPRA
jgi:DNA polymerase-3 subunit gamma/tau